MRCWGCDLTASVCLSLNGVWFSLALHESTYSNPFAVRSYISHSKVVFPDHSPQPPVGDYGGGSQQEVPQSPQLQCTHTGHHPEKSDLNWWALQPSHLWHYLERAHHSSQCRMQQWCVSDSDSSLIYSTGYRDQPSDESQ